MLLVLEPLVVAKKIFSVLGKVSNQQVRFIGLPEVIVSGDTERLALLAELTPAFENAATATTF